MSRKASVTKSMILDNAFTLLREEGIDIDTYGCYEPSLNDIFVACVGDENHTEEEGGE